MTIDLSKANNEWTRCRCCGTEGDEVLERVKRINYYDHNKLEELEKLRLCDFCACVGAICAGRHDEHIGNLTMREFSGILQTLVWKIREDRGDNG